MKPIEERADLATMQALRCVQYRLPHPLGMKREGFILSLALRYGLVGAAAFHHLLITTEEKDEQEVLVMMECWADIVEDHAQWEIAPRWPFPYDQGIPEAIGSQAGNILRSFLPLYQRLYPLERSLHLLAADFTVTNRGLIEGPWYKRGRRSAQHAFRAAAADSIHFAKGFFDRRQADLDEVPEIALIGE
jgi:hypothetical protein